MNFSIGLIGWEFRKSGMACAPLKAQFLKIWNKLKPILRKPRWWVAKVLRAFLWRTTFIAITGSNGKTTATRFLAAILSEHAPTQWTRLNRNGPGGITETIAFCKPWKTRYAIFEVGFGKLGSIRRAANLIRPHIAVVLSVFLEHRTELRSLEVAAREKAELLKPLSANGIAVLNADDPLVSEMQAPPGSKTIRYGSSTDNDAFYEDAVSAWPRLLQFTAVVGGHRQEIRTRMLGTHWIGSILPCIVVARHLGVSFEKIARTIEKVPPYPGRMQVVHLPSGVIVVRDEFKGSEHSTRVAFEELRKADANRKFLVFCDAAESSRKPRDRLAKTGREAANLFDYVLFIGERGHHGVSGACKAGMPEDRAQACSDYVEAVKFLQPILEPGDIVLLKAGRDNQLTRLFYSLIDEVRCTIPRCNRPMVCDDCPDFKNPEQVSRVNEQLTVGAQ